ncbi:4946_t:CDS:2, partial [Acaulospora colombiana]
MGSHNFKVSDLGDELINYQEPEGDRNFVPEWEYTSPSSDKAETG